MRKGARSSAALKDHQPALAPLCDAGLTLQPGDLIDEVMARLRKRVRSPADVPDELGKIVVLLASA